MGTYLSIERLLWRSVAITLPKQLLLLISICSPKSARVDGRDVSWQYSCENEWDTDAVLKGFNDTDCSTGPLIQEEWHSADWTKYVPQSICEGEGLECEYAVTTTYEMGSDGDYVTLNIRDSDRIMQL